MIDYVQCFRWLAVRQYVVVIILGLVGLLLTFHFNINSCRFKLKQLMIETQRLQNQLSDSANKKAESPAIQLKEKHYFSELSLNAIHYVGLIKDQEKSWALISTTNKRPVYVQEGNYLGLSKALVIRFNEKQLELEERQPGEGLTEPKKMVLNLKSSG